MAESNAVRELDIISYLSNPLVRQIVASVASNLECSSDLGKVLKNFYVKLPKSYCPEEGALRAYLDNLHKFTDVEIGMALAKRIQYSTISTDGVEHLIKGFVSYHRNSQILKIVNKYYGARTDDADTAQIEMLNAIEKLPRDLRFFELIDLSSSNIDEILEEESGESAKLPSKFNFYNISSAYGAYVLGNLIGVNAPPGVGKTMFMLCEICEFLKQGFNVVWVALGDMTRSDFLIRCTSIIRKIDFFEVTLNPKKYINDEVLEYLSHLRLIIKPAGVLSATDVTSDLLAIDKDEFDYRIFVLDYDDNLKIEDENMYEQGGLAYASFTQVTKEKGHFRLGFIGSQVKQGFWEEEELPENCSAGSSKKQTVIDAQININRNKEVPEIGTMLVAKQRRGSLTKSKYKLLRDGGFQDISWGEYQEIYAASKHHS